MFWRITSKITTGRLLILLCYSLLYIILVTYLYCFSCSNDWRGLFNLTSMSPLYCLHLMLKDKFQGNRMEILCKMENELEKRFELWSKTFEGLRSVSTDSSHLKSESDILKYSKLCDQFHDPKRVVTAEETTIDKLIEQREVE